MIGQPDPSHIVRTAAAFWSSTVLLTAVELDLFMTGNPPTSRGVRVD